MLNYLSFSRSEHCQDGFAITSWAVTRLRIVVVKDGLIDCLFY